MDKVDRNGLQAVRQIFGTNDQLLGTSASLYELGVEQIAGQFFQQQGRGCMQGFALCDYVQS